MALVLVLFLTKKLVEIERVTPLQVYVEDVALLLSLLALYETQFYNIQKSLGNFMTSGLVSDTLKSFTFWQAFCHEERWLECVIILQYSAFQKLLLPDRLQASSFIHTTAKRTSVNTSKVILKWPHASEIRNMTSIEKASQHFNAHA